MKLNIYYKQCFKLMIIVYFYSLVKYNNFIKTNIIINNIDHDNFTSFYCQSIKINNNDFIYINLTELKYVYSVKSNVIKINYQIGVFDDNKKIILPSDLIFYYNLHIVCYLKIKDEKVEIKTLPSIYNNKYYECNEFIKINEKILLGINIYQSNIQIKNKTEILFPETILNYNKIFYKNDSIFEILKLNKENLKYSKRINNNNRKKSSKLEKIYRLFPIFNLKRVVSVNKNRWYFKNIYYNYFCFCKGNNCIEDEYFEKCKYYFYLNVIESNKNIYKKENYLFFDFILKKYSSDDVYPVFKEMYKKNMPVHYITEKNEIYQKYCNNIKKCLSIILVKSDNYIINGNFLEKYLTLLLKLRQVISGGGIYLNYINNLFYDIEYITYICITHGVSFFKYFLYEPYNFYGNKQYDKLLIPPSKKIISDAINNGWKKENIIKINLPRWDNYNNLLLESNNNKSEIYTNSIFLMFTWRKFKKGKYLSKYYFRNILKLINNKKLNLNLGNSNIIFYVTLHHKLNKYKNKFTKNKYIHFLEENEISHCLSKINLVISDFSSIIFDLIYRRKPFIIYIPDAKDPNIKNIYDKNYYDLIQSLKNGTIYFENKYFELKDVINKIIYYINNNFTLEKELEKFYDSFELKKRNNVKDFINYIIKLN